MKLNLIYIGASSALLASAVNAASISTRQLSVEENQCNFVDSRYFITPLRVSGDKAAAYCQSLGGNLVDVDNRNSMDLTAMVSKCLASAERSVRIQTWDTNSFGTNHLAMSNEAGPPAVNVAPENEELFALCSMVETQAYPSVNSALAQESETTLAAAACMYFFGINTSL